MAGMVIHFTAITGLVHASTAAVGEAAMAGGDNIVGIETKIMHQDRLYN